VRRSYPPIPKLCAPAAKLGAFAISLFVVIGLAAPAAAQSPFQAATETTKQAQTAQAPNPAAATAEKTSPGAERTAPISVEEKIEQIAASGRIQQIGESPSARLNPAPPLAPGAPPILAFRYFDGRARHRFGNLDLVMDDAGH
jgi:hypothetical protein